MASGWIFVVFAHWQNELVFNSVCHCMTGNINVNLILLHGPVLIFKSVKCHIH